MVEVPIFRHYEALGHKTVPQSMMLSLPYIELIKNDDSCLLAIVSIVAGLLTIITSSRNKK